jgi:hypothetical protein
MIVTSLRHDYLRECRISCISNHSITKAGIKKAKAKTGTVTLIQRFGGSINFNVHFHQLTIDGVYKLDETLKPMIFHPTSATTVPELQSVLAAIIKKITIYLEKSGIIIRDNENKEFQLEIAPEYGMNILLCEIDEDHVHLQIEIPPQRSVGNGIGILKSVSARMMSAISLAEV